jgi:hypothetical protein
MILTNPATAGPLADQNLEKRTHVRRSKTESPAVVNVAGQTEQESLFALRGARMTWCILALLSTVRS